MTLLPKLMAFCGACLMAFAVVALLWVNPVLAQQVLKEPFPIQTQATFACTQANEGQLSCQVGTQCECKYYKTTREREAHFKWDCGIKRPSCPMVYHVIPGAQQLPPGFTIGRLPGTNGRGDARTPDQRQRGNGNNGNKE